ncbi:hypothetical protein ACS0TY_000753 [Phlomoides rotata]
MLTNAMLLLHAGLLLSSGAAIALSIIVIVTTMGSRFKKALIAESMRESLHS